MICGSLFSGIGLLDYGLELAGIEHAWFCEADEWRRGVLSKRWPGRQIHADVRHVGHGCEPVDLIAGGFPCKGISSAGKRTGFGHPESVLWREMARAIRELRPRYVLVENVDDILALHDGAIWGEVLRDLAEGGFDVRWDVLPAAAVGAPHLRQRVIAVAADASRDAEGGAGSRAGTNREQIGQGDHAAADSASARCEACGCDRLRTQPRFGVRGCVACAARPHGVAIEWGEYEPAIRRWEAVHGPAPEPLVRGMDDRSARRVERSRLSALGDGVQVQIGRIVGEYLLSLEMNAEPST